MDTRASAGRRAIGLTGGAFLLAVATLIGTALLAVPLNELPGAGAPGPSSELADPSRPVASPPANRSPEATLLPERLSVGGPLGVRYLPIQAANGYRVLDLDRGEPGRDLVRFPTHATVLALPDGRLVCACFTPVGEERKDRRGSRVRRGSPRPTPWATATAAKVEVRIFSPDGRLLDRLSVGTYKGSRAGWDPDDGAPFDIGASLSADRRFAFVGWTSRQKAGWRTGIDVVDLAAKVVVQRIRMPDREPVSGGAEAVPSVPTVEASPRGRRLVITQSVVVGGSIAELDHWAARLSGGRVEGLRPFATGHGTVAECAREVDFEIGTDSVYVGLCSSPAGFVVRRVDLEGRPLGDTAVVPKVLLNEGWPMGHVVDRSSGAYMLWDGYGRSLTRIDLTTGAITASAVLPDSPVADAGSPFAVLGAIGRWLAPGAAAKILLGASLALSPDGRRLYVLDYLENPGLPGRSAIWVLDARRLVILDRWQPPAHIIAITLSRDGRLLFAEGLAGIDASGSQRTEQGTSLTVYDASDGTLRLLLGQLGDEWLRLEPGLMP